MELNANHFSEMIQKYIWKNSNQQQRLFDRSNGLVTSLTQTPFNQTIVSVKETPQLIWKSQMRNYLQKQFKWETFELKNKQTPKRKQFKQQRCLFFRKHRKQTLFHCNKWLSNIFEVCWWKVSQVLRLEIILIYTKCLSVIWNKCLRNETPVGKGMM